jgi:lipopolysaccharide biosynthesis glycosyltransferase
LNICIAFSPNWFKYILISLFALLKTNKSPIKVYLLSDNLSSNDFLALNKLFSNFDGCEYKYFNLLEKFNKFINNVNVSTKFTKYTLYRLFIPYIISETKLLYLDADTVVNGDISQFYNMNMEDYWIAGCEDTGLQRRYKTSIGLKENDIYINAGVCLVNNPSLK